MRGATPVRYAIRTEDRSMPIIDITLLEGRSQEQKEKLVAKVTEAAMESLGAPRDWCGSSCAKCPSTISRSAACLRASRSSRKLRLIASYSFGKKTPSPNPLRKGRGSARIHAAESSGVPSPLGEKDRMRGSLPPRLPPRDDEGGRLNYRRPAEAPARGFSLKLCRGVIASGSTRSSRIDGRPDACAASKAPANSSVFSTTAPKPPKARA